MAILEPRRQAGGRRMRTHVVVYHGVPEGRLYRIPDRSHWPLEENVLRNACAELFIRL
jgi:hypothetical protein